MAANSKPVNPDEGWNVVSEETATKVIFEAFGESFTGVKVNEQIIEMPPDRDGKVEDPFKQFQFRGWGEFDRGTLWGINESYKLMPLETVPNGKLVKVTYVKDVAVGKGNDMRDFRILSRDLTAEEKKLYGF